MGEVRLPQRAEVKALQKVVGTELLMAVEMKQMRDQPSS